MRGVRHRLRAQKRHRNSVLFGCEQHPEGSADPVTEQSAAAALAGSTEPDDIGPFYRRNTPSAAGYVVAAFSALGIGSVLVPVALGGGAGGAANFFMFMGSVLAVGFFVMLTIGFPLTLIAHYAVRRIQRQSIHIATFGVVGLLTGYLLRLGLGYLSGLPLSAVVAVGVSAAAGRAVVNHQPR